MASPADLYRDGSDRDEAVLAGHTLAFNAAAIDLARAIWCARRRAFDEARRWDDLTARERHRLVFQAGWILRTSRTDLL